MCSVEHCSDVKRNGNRTIFPSVVALGSPHPNKMGNFISEYYRFIQLHFADQQMDFDVYFKM